MSHPAQVLDHKATLLEKMGDADYQRFLARFLRSFNAANAVQTTDTSVKAWQYQTAARLVHADCYYVKADMTIMVEWAAQQLAETDVFQLDLAPTDMGFAWFDEPIKLVDVWGDVNMVRAVQWYSSRTEQDEAWDAPNGSVTYTSAGMPGVGFTFWADLTHPQDAMHIRAIEQGDYEEGLQRLGRLQPIHTDIYPWGLQVGPHDLPADSDNQVSAYRKNKRPDYIPDERVLPGSIPNLKRQVLAFWMLLGQTVTVVSDSEVPRPFAKRAGKANIPKRVTVIELRRHAGSRQPGESLVEWAHRWVVRGHWRNQPYKAEDGSIIYKRIFIAPYVKGPADKPIVVTEKVYALVR